MICIRMYVMLMEHQMRAVCKNISQWNNRLSAIMLSYADISISHFIGSLDNTSGFN